MKARIKMVNYRAAGLMLVAGLLGGMSLALVSGCAGSASRVNEKALARVSIEQAATFGRAMPGEDYRLQPGDRVSIRFPFQKELNEKVSVRPDGKVSLEAAGEIQAAGLTTKQLAELVAERSSRVARDPQVYVNLDDFAEERVYVGGEVNQPGYVSFREDMTPLQAILERGGFKDTASVENVLRLERQGDGSFTSERIDLEAVVENGLPEKVRLSPDDIVFVPKSGIAKANLVIQQYIRNMLPVDSGATASTRIP